MTDKEKFKRPGSKPAGRPFKTSAEKPGKSGPKSFGAQKKFGEKADAAPRDKSDAAPRPRPDAAPRKSATPAAKTGSEDTLKPERISKLLARAGIASRRDVERMIMEGRVAVNGKVLDSPVLNATLADRIEVDGEPIRGIERTRLWLYHKPSGLVTTNSDPEGRPTVFDNLPEELPRVMSIGRLDINTEGLLLLTNDGGLARVLELPTTGWLRRYRVRAYGEIDQAKLDTLKDGIAVDGVLYGAIDAVLDRSQGHNVWITMGLREGKNREIKNVLGALGLEVNRLIRISYGPFQLGDLPESQVQEVRGRMLRDQLGPRLIEESKANFDAPLYSNAPAEEDDAPAPKAKAKAEEGNWKKDTRPAKPRGFDNREDAREKALSRLDTRRDGAKPAFGSKPGFGGKPGFKGKPAAGRDGDDAARDGKPKRMPLGQSRTANVWMAPGARPVSEKKTASDEARKSGPRARPDGAPQTKRYGRTKDGAPTKSLSRHDPDRGQYAGSDDKDLRVKVSRARDAEGEWIRAEGPDSKPAGRGGRAGEGFGGKRDGADRGARPAYGDKPAYGDRPARGERAAPSDRPSRGQWPTRADRPDRGERPARSDAPARSDRPYSGRPTGERAERPTGDRPYDGRPKSRSASGDKPSFGGKPGGKPGSARPGSTRSDAGRGPSRGPSSGPKGKR
ncbi:pseudouridine synthase [Agrobacterium vitis]|uniref:pseudouridine synthase n=1 Tax=Rhizobium/Agrobacterium group TaxID=227290 RepID=UPI0008DBEA0B|nr:MULTISPECIES: pseudouridine synthase [Rhizobium/Agrobacterium group]MCF1434810.1 pseudouridine synthase [Allorhizobium ampelinum]MUO88240.1 pseudouridine synthase [Agrobacterium vitis]MUZ53638.1 pseudouridine synthase [Agrobacterium vitis]MUZ93353.1 pseudouridine synthase [Agrobacterium vitis]MVA41009.1 pseudouridine synthase [Agrobacterium vitis]